MFWSGRYRLPKPHLADCSASATRDHLMAILPTPDPTPTPVPTPPPFPDPKPMREPDPERLPDEEPVPNPDENDVPPKHSGALGAGPRGHIGAGHHR